MRKIEVKTWIVRNPDGTPVPGLDGKSKTESTVDALEALIQRRKAGSIPDGFDAFRTLGRIARAFDQSRSSGFIMLEEADYVVLKSLVEKDVPASWGLNLDVLGAVEAFMDAKTE